MMYVIKFPLISLAFRSLHFMFYLSLKMNYVHGFLQVRQVTYKYVVINKIGACILWRVHYLN